MKETSISDEIEGEIIQILEAISSKDWGLWGKEERTQQIKERIGSIGENQKDKGWSVWAGECKYRKHGEWLFDMTWLHYSGDILLSVPLVLESEWKRTIGDIMDDFQKMLLARADRRVMIFGAQTEKEGMNIVFKLKEQVERFERTEPSDQYIFAFWCDEAAKFICYPYTTRKESCCS